MEGAYTVHNHDVVRGARWTPIQCEISQAAVSGRPPRSDQPWPPSQRSERGRWIVIFAAVDAKAAKFRGCESGLFSSQTFCYFPARSRGATAWTRNRLGDLQIVVAAAFRIARQGSSRGNRTGNRIGTEATETLRPRCAVRSWKDSPNAHGCAQGCRPSIGGVCLPLDISCSIGRGLKSRRVSSGHYGRRSADLPPIRSATAVRSATRCSAAMAWPTCSIGGMAAEPAAHRDGPGPRRLARSEVGADGCADSGPGIRRVRHADGSGPRAGRSQGIASCSRGIRRRRPGGTKQRANPDVSRRCS